MVKEYTLSEKIKIEKYGLFKARIKALEIYKMLQNDNVCIILDYLSKNKRANITELQHVVGLKTYASAFSNIEKLMKYGLIIKRKNNLESGRPSYIELSQLSKLMLQRDLPEHFIQKYEEDHKNVN